MSCGPRSTPSRVRPAAPARRPQRRAVRERRAHAAGRPPPARADQRGARHLPHRVGQPVAVARAGRAGRGRQGHRRPDPPPGRRAQITIHAPAADDPTWTVQADRQRLKQVLLNLASNAVKYNRHAGTIRVTCQATPEGRVAVAVQDTGPGLSPDKMARLFSPFDRLGPRTPRSRAPAWGWPCPRDWWRRWAAT